MRNVLLRLGIVAASVVATGCASVTGAPRGVSQVGGVQTRIYDVAAERFIPFDTLVARAAAADVVFFGEQHGHRPGHRLQLELLRALAARDGATLSLEMFERDVANLVSAYASGDTSLAALMADARPWPRFDTDYRPQVDLARRQGWAVLAANVPRQLASLVAQQGIAALDTLDATRRAWAAAELRCPEDAYRTRFVEEMRQHPVGNTEAERAAIEQRYYEAQCVKDETMAESIATALAAGMERPVVHLTGAFHSDHGDGIPVRLLRRAPQLDIVSLTLVPVADLRAADPLPHTRRADYLLFTRTEAR